MQDAAVIKIMFMALWKYEQTSLSSKRTL